MQTQILSHRRISVRQLNLFDAAETDSTNNGKSPAANGNIVMLHTAQQIISATNPKAKAMVAENMQISDKWLIRGLMAIYRRQTADEQNSESTKYDNGIGFGGCDSQILSSFAKVILNRRFLSTKQMAVCRRLMAKYSMQLVRIAKAKHNAEMIEASRELVTV